MPASSSWELGLVDNDSSDRTVKVLSFFGERSPIRYVLEEKPGLSNARNRAVAEAPGKYIIWTDDDVLVDGGPIEPW